MCDCAAAAVTTPRKGAALVTGSRDSHTLVTMVGPARQPLLDRREPPCPGRMARRSGGLHAGKGQHSHTQSPRPRACTHLEARDVCSEAPHLDPKQLDDIAQLKGPHGRERGLCCCCSRLR